MADQTSSQQPRVMFRTPEEEEEEQRPPHRPLGRLTTKYDRRDLQRRLDIEQWMETQLQLLFDCQQEDQVPELQIDVDELQELSDSEQRSRLNRLLQDCGKPTEDFINSLLYQIRGLNKLRK
ncbi:protein phosphatase 1 regulatory subunit 14B isoform X2 [Lates calcarifer]|uniref:Protein phosphatase 1 regulatory subunit 14B isoform X2 n=1 Tax=Lates calcarifer TaxID=8187 RepID=A0AAJ7PZ00_LATCA|nr:protein phosphatase 1 regulatory subunit 14B isoform X2 [Lates calcarifer]